MRALLLVGAAEMLVIDRRCLVSFTSPRGHGLRNYRKNERMCRRRSTIDLNPDLNPLLRPNRRNQLKRHDRDIFGAHHNWQLSRVGGFFFSLSTVLYCEAPIVWICSRFCVVRLRETVWMSARAQSVKRLHSALTCVNLAWCSHNTRCRTYVPQANSSPIPLKTTGQPKKQNCKSKEDIIRTTNENIRNTARRTPLNTVVACRRRALTTL